MHIQAKDSLRTVPKLLYIEWPNGVVLFVLFFPPRPQILLKIPDPRQAVIPVTLDSIPIVYALEQSFLGAVVCFV